jgi:hypothetical protein
VWERRGASEGCHGCYSGDVCTEGCGESSGRDGRYERHGRTLWPYRGSSYQPPIPWWYADISIFGSGDDGGATQYAVKDADNKIGFYISPTDLIFSSSEFIVSSLNVLDLALEMVH